MFRIDFRFTVANKMIHMYEPLLCVITCLKVEKNVFQNKLIHAVSFYLLMMSIITGGYIKDLIGSRQRVESFIADLEDEKWIDQYTRSIFVEFVVFNPNVNLFAMINVVFESPTAGNFQGELIIHSFR